MLRAYITVLIIFSATLAAKNSWAESLSQEQKINKFIDQMPLEQKVGQLLIFGFSGTTFKNRLSRTLDLLHPGAIIVFGHNIRSAMQIAQLNYQMQKAALRTSKVPMFIAVDQEGGEVIRIKTNPPLPSALSLGKTKNILLTREVGFHSGTLLKSLGFNINLAPVLDLSDPSKKSFIGTRSFGSNPTLVGKFGSAFSEGLVKAGILATAKHYPGHGGIELDSHVEPISRFNTLSDLLKFDLMPFVSLTKNKALSHAIMVAHIAFPKVDPSRAPATFSPILVQEILRNKLKFEGIVITDDIEMGAAHSIPDVGERAIRAIEAGNDLIMVVWSWSVQKKVHQALVKAVQAGRLTMSRIDDSLRRILKYKNKFVGQPAPPNKALITRAISNPSIREISNRVLKINLDNSLEPESIKKIRNTEGPIFVFSTSYSFYQQFKKWAGNRKTKFVFIGKAGARNFNNLILKTPGSLGVFYVAGPQTGQLLSRFSTAAASKVVIVNTRTRGQLPSHSSFLSVVDVHSGHPQLGDFLGQAFFKNPLRQISGLEKD